MNNTTLQTHISVEDNETIADTKAKDLQFMGVMFLMVLMMLIPLNYILKKRQRLLNKQNKLSEFHIAFVIVIHVLFYTLFGFLIIPAIMNLTLYFIPSPYSIYIVFPLSVFL